MDPAALREETVNAMAHALRNVLNALRLKADGLDLAIPPSHPSRSLTESLRREVGRLIEAVEEMLLYGRPYRPEVRSFTVGALLDELATAYRQGVHGYRLELEVDPAGRDIEVIWDRHAIRTALERIADNAAEHTPEPHRAWVSARREGGEVVVEVRDEGEGIEPHILPRVTEPFFPQHHGRMGLGLAVADKMVRTHGGRIEVESSPGAGTTVRLVLPREVVAG